MAHAVATGGERLVARTGEDPLAVLATLADHPWLCCLWGGPGRGMLIRWGTAPRPLSGLADIHEPAGRMGAADTRAWPESLVGGALLQCDYEFPVGDWATVLPGSSEPRAWTWDLERGLRLAADGRIWGFGGGDLPSTPHRLPDLVITEPLRPAWEEAAHAQRVDHIRDRIAAGDLYQANLTVPFCARLQPVAGADVALFARLVSRSPAGYAALLRTPGASIISHSPECFLTSDGTTCRSAPIKGTRPRVPGREAVVRQSLAGAEKDKAELAMIVDLVRNDLGRVARIGGVRLERPPSVVDLDYVHHLLAVVAADLRPGIRVADLLRAAFPAGSITGAPKIAAMERIRELECGPRGPYCGTFGWMAAGEVGPLCSLAVAIRTMVLTADGSLRAQVGGGIVADSDGAAEWREACDKLAGMAGAVAATP